MASILIMEKSEFIVQLNEHNCFKENVFFIHDVLGNISAYIPLSKALKSEFNFFGVGSYLPLSLYPQNISIEDYSKTIVDKIKRIQKKKYIHIAGWSIGGIFAYEIARQLELNNYELKLFMFDTSIISSTEPHEISYENEINLVAKYINLPADENFNHSIEKLWDYITNCILDNPAILNKLNFKGLKKYLELMPTIEKLSIVDQIKYLSLIRTILTAGLNYQPNEPLKSQLTFFLPHCSTANSAEWKKYCKKLNIFQVEGDHYTMLKGQNIVKLAKIFKSVINQ